MSDGAQLTVFVRSIGSRCGSYNNALAATIIRPLKAQDIHHVGLRKDIGNIEFTTRCWVSRYNTEHLMELLGYLPPAEYEA